MTNRKTETPLRKARRARLLNQDQFAQVLGISQNSLSRMERGQQAVKRDLQELMATVLGVPRADLFPESEALAS